MGELIPQYNGLLTHEVTYRPGNRDRSQSANVTSARTEAPGRHPSPAYLALFCHRQARCGGGHTDLLDVRKLVGALDADELALMTDAELHFPGPDGGVHTTMLSTDAGGNTVTRFSYNLLTTADDDPTLGADVDPSGLPLGEAGRGLAHRISDLFRELRTSVLIPGRLAADLGQPADVACAVGVPRPLPPSDRVLEHRLEAGVTIDGLAHRHGLTLDGRRDHGA